MIQSFNPSTILASGIQHFLTPALNTGLTMIALNAIQNLAVKAEHQGNLVEISKWNNQWFVESPSTSLFEIKREQILFEESEREFGCKRVVKSLAEVLSEDFENEGKSTDEIKFWLECPGQMVLHKMLSIYSGYYWIHSAELSARQKALQFLAHKIEQILPSSFAQSMNSTLKDCCSSNCAAIDAEKVHPREKQATETIYTSHPVNSTREDYIKWISSKFIPPEWEDVQEVLRFRCDDPREKFLFISAEYDHNGALNPSLIATILSKLSQSFDLKFQVVRSNEELCKAIGSGRKTGNLAHVIISGHGNPKEILLDENVLISETMDFANCFSAIQPNGKILLMSCSTGKERNNDPFNNIAQKIADSSKKTVIAPTNDAYSALINLLSEDDAALYHPENRLYSLLPFYNVNLFTSFRPTFKKCYPDIDQSKITPRELAAIEAVKAELVAKSLLHKDEPSDKTTKYLQICKDDPREKVLFFSAEYDKNGALEPNLSAKILSVFADRFDLRYKVVKSLSEICQAIDQAAKCGKVVTVLIQAHGTSTEGMLLSIDPNGKENRIKASDDFSKCFSPLQQEGTIVLMGGSLGQNAEHKDNIAQKISNDSERTVLATTCPIYVSRTTVQSIKPLILKHPGYPSVMNFLYERCPENNENHFKTFNKK